VAPEARPELAFDFRVEPECRPHRKWRVTLAALTGLRQEDGAAVCQALADRRNGVSHREPLRQTGKTALRFDPVAWSRRSGLIEHRGDQRSAAGFLQRRV
jgi:hypothetical protein